MSSFLSSIHVVPLYIVFCLTSHFLDLIILLCCYLFTIYIILGVKEFSVIFLVTCKEMVSYMGVFYGFLRSVHITGPFAPWNSQRNQLTPLKFCLMINDRIFFLLSSGRKNTVVFLLSNPEHNTFYNSILIYRLFNYL